MSLMRSIKRSFWRGVAALLPALLSFIVLVMGISFVHSYAGQYVNKGLQLVVHWATGIPLDDVQDWYARYWLAWLGVVVAVILLCVIAWTVGTFIGGRLMRFAEGWILRIPLMRKIYPGAKQVSDFFFSKKRLEFRRVVAIQYPRLGLWMLGFVTGRSFSALSKRVGRELLSIFIPTSPAPVTGIVVTVPEEEVIDLPISVDEAIQYIISGGMIMPPAERMESLEEALLVEGEAPPAPPETPETPAKP